MFSEPILFYETESWLSKKDYLYDEVEHGYRIGGICKNELFLELESQETPESGEV